MGCPNIRNQCSSVGSDESGHGGLFGGFAVAAFCLNKQNIKALQKHEWCKEIKDSKELDPEKIRNISSQIKEHFEEGKDFVIANVDVKSCNELTEKHGGDIRKALAEIHSLLHYKLENSFTFHILPNFFKKNRQNKYFNQNEAPGQFKIDYFCQVAGENQFWSIALASILASDSYLNQLREISKALNIEISNEVSHKKKIKAREEILEKLSLMGKSREYISTTFCKANEWKKHESNLKNHKKQKAI
ncbi:hypothetical protein [Candidatus Mycoplasma haematohominis]|uniref:hypothetical protein n=1 Tax=Candidatus Mycoplasma haematohominis TaxID=1494318 RepID=UPI001C0A6A83|nr:hypothetical protein [Candidatus Mycoplasma haemohominis]